MIGESLEEFTKLYAAFLGWSGDFGDYKGRCSLTISGDGYGVVRDWVGEKILEFYSLKDGTSALVALRSMGSMLRGVPARPDDVHGEIGN